MDNSVWTPSENHFSEDRGHRSASQTKLDADLGVLDMFEIRPVRHRTSVWQCSAADHLVSLRGAKPASLWTALNNVQDALRTRLLGTTILIRRPKGACRFSNGDVEMVPGYDADNGYSIPHPILGWMQTDPSKHNAYIDDVTKKFNDAAKKLAQQLKIWKYRREVPMSSCYLEMHVARHVEEKTAYLPVVGLSVALKNLQTATLGAMNNPTGIGSPIPATSFKASKTDALPKLEMAVTRAQRAKDSVRRRRRKGYLPADTIIRRLPLRRRGLGTRIQ